MITTTKPASNLKKIRSVTLTDEVIMILRDEGMRVTGQPNVSAGITSLALAKKNGSNKHRAI